MMNNVILVLCLGWFVGSFGAGFGCCIIAGMWQVLLAVLLMVCGWFYCWFGTVFVQVLVGFLPDFLLSLQVVEV